MVHIKKKKKSLKKGWTIQQNVGNAQVSKWSETESQLPSGRFQIACSSYYVCLSNRQDVRAKTRREMIW